MKVLDRISVALRTAGRSNLVFLNYRHYNAQSIVKDLRDILQRENIPSQPQTSCVSQSPSSLANAARDASSYTVELPEVCITPQSLQQVQKCVKYCYKNGIPIIPVGARTGLEGGIHAMKGGVSFDMSQMKDIMEINVNDLDCQVQAGISWRELNDNIKSHGLWFPVDPGASASIGGMSSTSASGTNAVKYGTMRENVINLEMVVRSGDIINTAGCKTRSKKTSAGINMTNLMVGSEGTLGIITSARLKLHALPTCLAVVTIAFPNVQAAADSVVELMQCGLPVARVEFLDQPAVKICYEANKLHNLDPDRTMLFLELHALSESGIADQIEILKDIVDGKDPTNFNWSSKLEERTELWKARHNLHWSILNSKPGSAAVDTDVCVPISKLPDMINMTHKLIKDFGLVAPLMGHAGDGNFHSVILYNPKEPHEFNRAKELAIEMGRVAIKLDGTVTGEHGVGRGKIGLLDEQFDKETLDLMYTVKRSLDPKNLYNPGKIFRPERLAPV